MPDTRDLVKRLDRLERQNRNLRRGLCVVGFVVAAFILIGAVEPNENSDVTFGAVEARKISIVDDGGKDRLVLELQAGEPVLTMLNHEGMQQVYLGIDENWNDGAYLSVCSRLENGSVDKQAMLVATAAQYEPSRLEKKARPGNSQLVLFDSDPKQETAADQHLVRLSSGRFDSMKPYFEIRELKDSRASQLNLELIVSEPTDAGQRFLLDTTPDKTAISGVDVSQR